MFNYARHGDGPPKRGAQGASHYFGIGHLLFWIRPVGRGWGRMALQNPHFFKNFLVRICLAECTELNTGASGTFFKIFGSSIFEMT